MACRARLAASLSRETLKLGGSKAEKAVAKECVKALISLVPETWASPRMAFTMRRAAKCISKNCSFDRATTNGLENFIKQCAEEAENMRTAVNMTMAEEEEEQNDDAALAMYEAQEAQREQEALEEHLFYSFAPGLLDLVELMYDEEDEEGDDTSAEHNENVRTMSRNVRKGSDTETSEDQQADLENKGNTEGIDVQQVALEI